MGGEPGDHRKAEPVKVIGELVQIGTVDAGIDQEQPALPAHRDGIAPDIRALQGSGMSVLSTDDAAVRSRLPGSARRERH